VDSRPDPSVSTLISLAHSLSQHGRFAEAAEAGSKAVSILRKRAHSGSASDLGELATSLLIVGSLQAQNSEFDAAGATIREAAAIFLRLCEEDLVTYFPRLMNCVHGLWEIVTEESDASALASYNRVQISITALYEKVHEAHPRVYLPMLVFSQRGAGKAKIRMLISKGTQEPQTLDQAAAAVSIYRRVRALDVELYGPLLATALTDYADQLDAAGRMEEAVTASEEAVELWRGGSEWADIAKRSSLFDASVQTARRLAALDRKAEALTFARKGLDEARRINVAGSNPLILADALHNCLWLAQACGKPVDVGYVTEFASVCMELAADPDDRHLPEFGRNLINVAYSLSEDDLDEYALLSARTAVRTFERLSEATPGRYPSELSLGNLILGAVCRAMGHYYDAVQPLMRAAALAEEIGDSGKVADAQTELIKCYKCDPRAVGAALQNVMQEPLPKWLTEPDE
jgi:tetratricopeptide (TPR) repeat protein